MNRKQYNRLNELLIKSLKGSQKSTLELALSLGVKYSYLKAQLAIVNKEIDQEANRLGISREEIITKYAKNHIP